MARPRRHRSWETFRFIALFVRDECLRCGDRAGADALNYLLDEADSLLINLKFPEGLRHFELVESESEGSSNAFTSEAEAGGPGESVPPHSAKRMTN